MVFSVVEWSDDAAPQDGVWAPNVEMFAWKLGKHREFLENVYFTFLFLSRAVTKV